MSEIGLKDQCFGAVSYTHLDVYKRQDEGYILDTTPQEVELKAGDGIKELTFFNDMKPGMKLIKVDSADPVSYTHLREAPAGSSNRTASGGFSLFITQLFQLVVLLALSLVPWWSW